MFRIFFILMLTTKFVYASDFAPQPWVNPPVPQESAQNILYLPIADNKVIEIKIIDSEEKLIDLLQINNPRIKSLVAINKDLCPAYEGYSRVRLGVYNRLVDMLNYLPQNIGIAFCEGMRPLTKQKEYFDKKFLETLKQGKDKDQAYTETSKVVSPFINNVPTHCTGAAIDMTLFYTNGTKNLLVEMGAFDTTLGINHQEEMFSIKTNDLERKNRLLLLNAATKAGFVGYGFEWWHYSYGDKMWAYVKREKNAIYGLAVPKNDPIFLITKEEYLKEFDAVLH